MQPWTACLCLFCAMALVGSNVPLGKVIVAQVPVLLFIFFRFALSVVALIALLPSESLSPKHRKIRELSIGEWGLVALMSFIGMVLFSILILEGVKRTAATDAGIITATMPAMVALLGLIVFREMPTRPMIIAIGLAVLGIGLIQVDPGDNQKGSLVGNIMVIGAVVCEATFVILAKGLSRSLSPVRLALAANIVGLILILPLAWGEITSFDYRSIDITIGLLMVWYILAASVFALLLWYRGLPDVDTAIAGLMTTALPLSAMAVSVIFLGEALSWVQIAGAGMVIAAIWLGAFSRSRVIIR